MTHTVVHTVKPSLYNDPVTDDSVGAFYHHLEDVMINTDSCFHDCSLLRFPFNTVIASLLSVLVMVLTRYPFLNYTLLYY